MVGPEDADPATRAVWLDCMPALHRPECAKDCKRHTIRIEVIRAEYDKAVRENKLSDFSRAFLNQWKAKPREVKRLPWVTGQPANASFVRCQTFGRLVPRSQRTAIARRLAAVASSMTSAFGVFGRAPQRC